MVALRLWPAYQTATSHSWFRFATRYAAYGTPLDIRHLVLDESSNWVIADNAILRSDVLQQSENVLAVSGPDGSTLRMPLITHDCHIYISAQLFSTTLRIATHKILALSNHSSHMWPGLITHLQYHRLRCNLTKFVQFWTRSTVMYVNMEALRHCRHAQPS